MRTRLCATSRGRPVLLLPESENVLLPLPLSSALPLVLFQPLNLHVPVVRVPYRMANVPLQRPQDCR